MGRLQLESALWAGVRGHHLENVGGSASEDWTLRLCFETSIPAATWRQRAE